MKLSLFCIAAIAIVVCSASDGKVIMEYVGDQGFPISLESVPIDPSISFHFILAFAVDANSNGEPQHGLFAPYWSASITPASIQSVKARHHNVKVLAGIFGDNEVGWYKIQNREDWITNAFNSIQSLVTNYHLDGVDIDYEAIPTGDTSFVYCIGQLITRLKSHRVITVATISPNHGTARHYIRLYRNYPSVIDFVNHQFDTDGVKSPTAYLRYYRLRATQFYRPKLLPNYEVNMTTAIQGDAFFEAMRLLESNGYHVNGLVVYSADASKSTGYYFEKKAQAFLLGKNNTWVQ